MISPDEVGLDHVVRDDDRVEIEHDRQTKIEVCK